MVRRSTLRFAPDTAGSDRAHTTSTSASTYGRRTSTRQTEGVCRWLERLGASQTFGSTTDWARQESESRVGDMTASIETDMSSYVMVEAPTITQASTTVDFDIDTESTVDEALAVGARVQSAQEIRYSEKGGGGARPEVENGTILHWDDMNVRVLCSGTIVRGPPETNVFGPQRPGAEQYEWRVDNTSPEEIRSFQFADFVRDPADHNHAVGHPKTTPSPSYVYSPGAKLSLWLATEKTWCDVHVIQYNGPRFGNRHRVVRDDVAVPGGKGLHGAPLPRAPLEIDLNHENHTVRSC